MQAEKSVFPGCHAWEAVLQIAPEWRQLMSIKRADALATPLQPIFGERGVHGAGKAEPSARDERGVARTRGPAGIGLARDGPAPRRMRASAGRQHVARTPGCAACSSHAMRLLRDDEGYLAECSACGLRGAVRDSAYDALADWRAPGRAFPMAGQLAIVLGLLTGVVVATAAVTMIWR